jgi:hypothetical protein
MLRLGGIFALGSTADTTSTAEAMKPTTVPPNRLW